MEHLITWVARALRTDDVDEELLQRGLLTSRSSTARPRGDRR
jgi:hypothetical protein